MKEFVFTGDTQNGILKYLFDSLSEEDYFNEATTYASMNSANHIGKCAIDFDSNSYWHAIDYQQEETFIVISLKSYYIKIKGFTITSSNLEASGICHPKNWGFDASNDNRTWHHRVLYTDTNNNMNRKLASGYFGWDYGTFKYFRFLNTGEQYDGQGKRSIDLGQIEFFGTLLTHLDDISKCLHTSFNHRKLFIFLIISIQE